MAQSKRSIHLSVGKIRKEMPGNHLENAGSACVLEWPWEIEQRQASRSENTNQIFLVALSQVISKSELYSLKVSADFLPISSGSTLTFRLNNLPPLHEVHEVQIAGHEDISLILIPTEPLHKQNFVSWLRKNKIKCDRPQLCHRGSELGFQAADVKPDRLFCYVVRVCETATQEKFDLNCYVLEADESGHGSYYLRVPYGNKAKLRKLEDFHRNEYPIGSVILNEHGEVVGFLAFGQKDEIVPVFLQGDNQASHVKNEVDMPEDSKSTEVRCSDDREESQSTDTEANGDVNKNKEDNMYPKSSLKKFQEKVRNKDTQDDSDDSQIELLLTSNPGNGAQIVAKDQHSFEPIPHDSSSSMEDLCDENLKTPANRSQPTELSYVSVTREGNSDDNMDETRSDGEEEGITLMTSQVVHMGTGSQVGNSLNQSPEAKKPPIQRSQSELPITPRSRRRLLVACRSEPGGPIPLKSDTLVDKVILNRVYVMDTLQCTLDTTYTRNVENWKHLANRQGVPDDRIMRLECQSPESRSESLFQLLKTTDPDLSIGTLKQHLIDLEMQNVVACIQDLDLHLQDHMKVDEVLDSGNVPGRFFTLLDQKEERVEEKWNNLGAKLGVDPSTLKGIKIDCANRHQNPAQDVIEMIFTRRPTMTTSQFKKHLENINRNDVIKKLDSYPGLNKLTIVNLRDNLDVMREVTCMLNGADNSQIKNFKDFADECRIPAEKYRSLQPPCAESPTKAVLDDIVGRKPFYTVRELFTDLREMNRLDVVEAISPYFVEEDVKALKRELRMTDE